MEDGQVIGRIYEERYVPADVRWFWSITEHVDPALGLVTNGRVPSLEEAKVRFRASWSRFSLPALIKVCPNRPMNMIAPNPQNAPVKEPPQPRPEPKEPPPPGPIDKPPAPPAPPPARFIQ
jgi:hypothetical protein